MKKYLSYLYIIIAAASWGCIGLFNRNLSSAGLSAMDIVVLRNIGAMLLLVLLFLFCDRSAFRIRLRHVPVFIGSGIVSVLLFSWCYFRAQQLMSLGCAATLLYTAPAFVVLLAALLWKKANHIHPTRSHNAFVQFCWNQLGVIMAGIILAPLAIVLIMKREDLDQKTKRIVAAVLAVVFLGAAAGSADYHPVTQDEVNEILNEADENGYTGEVYYTRYGHSYHFSLECQSLRRSSQENLYSGTLEDALAANRTDPCDFCANGRLVKEDGTVIDMTEQVEGAVESLENAA